MKRNILTKGLGTAIILTLGILTGCGADAKNEVSGSDDNGANAGSKVVKLGLTAVIDEELWKPIKEQLKTEGVDLEIMQFSDYTLPNNALSNGDIDINAFQHHAYFNNEVAEKEYKISAIGDTFITAMNIYSNKIGSVEELKEGDVVAIPDDVTNGGRALRLLDSAGVITLKDGIDNNPTIADIETYNTQITLTEVGAGNIPPMLPDVTAAVINGNYALDYKLDPEIAIFREKDYPDNSYFCLIAVREGEEDNEVYKRIVELFQSEQTKKIFTDTFNGYFVPAWEQ